MKYKSALTTSASGSVDGMTASRNRFGRYLRARAVPVNPNTGFQVQARAAFTTLVTRWIETLTAAQREAWRDYASNVPVLDALGDPINITGQNWYIACNVPRLQATEKLGAFVTLPLVDTAPAIYDRGTFTTPSFVADDTTGLDLTFDDTDAWANEDDSALLMYQGQMQNLTRDFYNGPWRLIGAVLGDATTPPTIPFAIPNNDINQRGYPIVPSMKNWLAVAVTRADGRLSTRRILGPVTTT